MVWFGWEMDVLPGMSRIGMPPVVAHNHDGSSDHRHRALGNDHAASTAASLPIELSQQIQAFRPDSYDSYPTASLDNRTPSPTAFSRR